MREETIYVFIIRGREYENVQLVIEAINKYKLKKIYFEKRVLAKHSDVISQLTLIDSIRDMAFWLEDKDEADGEAYKYLRGFSESRFRKHIIKYLEENYDQPDFYIHEDSDTISVEEFYTRFVNKER